MANQPEHLSSVYNAIRILQQFSDEQPELGITELSLRLGLAKSTVFRLMRTLMETDLVVKDPHSRKYRLGLGTFVIGSIAYRRLAIRDRSLPVLADLMHAVRRVVRLGIYDQGQVIYLLKLPEDKNTRLLSSIGQRVPVYCTAVGKVLLAYQTAEEIDRVLARPLKEFTAKTITEPQKLREQIALIRQQQFALTYEESTDGLCSAAVPVFDGRGRVVAAISVTAAKSHFLGYQVQQYLRLLRQSSQSVSAGLDAAP